MLSLSYRPNKQVEIEGQLFEINLSFDNILKLIDMLNDSELSEKYKVILGTNMLFGVSFLFPFDRLQEIFTTVFYTYIAKETSETVETDIQGNPMPPRYREDQASNYSLKYDADYIFASFYQAYQIDLIDQQGKLSWEKFNALLMGLPKDTKFKEVMEIRTWTPYKGCSKEEKNRMKKLQKLYALPEKVGES